MTTQEITKVAQPSRLGTLRRSIVRWARRRSIWVLHYNSGGCNGCDIEILDLLTPRYDVERLGILKEGSPRHADVLLCTGPVTRQSRARLAQIHAPNARAEVGGRCGLVRNVGWGLSGRHQRAWVSIRSCRSTSTFRLPMSSGSDYRWDRETLLGLISC